MLAVAQKNNSKWQDIWLILNLRRTKFLRKRQVGGYNQTWRPLEHLQQEAHSTHQSSGFARKMRRNYEFRLRAKAANILMFLSRFGPAAHVFDQKNCSSCPRKNISEHKLNPTFVLKMCSVSTNTDPGIPWLGFESSLFKAGILPHSPFLLNMCHIECCKAEMNI